MEVKPGAGFNGSVDTFSPDELIAGSTELRARKVTIKSGAAHVRGEVIGKITVGGKYILSAAAAGDGSEVPDLILAEDVDATGADKEAMAYVTGDFNERKLTLGAGHTVASITEGLRVKGIFLSKPIKGY
jgi:hypothetical protein